MSRRRRSRKPWERGGEAGQGPEAPRDRGPGGSGPGDPGRVPRSDRFGGPPGRRDRGPPRGPAGDGPLRRRLTIGFWVLIAAIVVLVIGGFLILSPFWDILFVAAVATTLLHPVYERILRWVGSRHRGLASVATCFLFVVVVVGPTTWLTFRVVVEATGALRSVAEKASAAIDYASRQEWAKEYLEEYPRFRAGVSWTKASLDRFAGQLEEPPPPPADSGSTEAGAADGGGEPGAAAVRAAEPGTAATPGAAPARESRTWISGEKITTLATDLAGLITKVLKGAVGLVFKLFLMLFLMFYFFKDGPEILRSIRAGIPVEQESQEKILQTFRAVSGSMLRGTFLTALAQGTLAGIAFAILGIPAVFWGTITGLAALLPAVGTGVVTVPITLTFALSGEVTKAVVMGIVAVVIATLDNVLRPLLVEGELRLHPVWILLAVLGGISVFGILGLVIGPMVVVLLRTLLAVLVASERRFDEPRPALAAAGAPGSRPAASPPRPPPPPPPPASRPRGEPPPIEPQRPAAPRPDAPRGGPPPAELPRAPGRPPGAGGGEPETDT